MKVPTRNLYPSEKEAGSTVTIDSAFSLGGSFKMKGGSELPGNGYAFDQ